MNYVTVVDVAALDEPVSLSEAKEQLRIEPSFTVDDAYIGALISTARDRSERFCNRYFSTQTVTILYDNAFPSGDVGLPFPDLSSVESIQYTAGGQLMTVDSADYSADLKRQTIYNASGWPNADAYRVQVVTGAPDEMAGVKQAILMMVADMYELRTESVIGASVAENPAVRAMLYPYRVNLGV